ncbi:protein translocase subunit SecD [Candidatus Kaiserbacteria bacterium CG10_big_fil_rev_8_21_14_0_10_49_17]|uniref:Protein translocase subunit SecD n=1 Tax=Candidatus Kaiserbacteria bacterium CG10_big_fil_rev_8_21_14_0_10_49_17 TaxID=1974609 RepID=A0A2M6WDU5_9BACT|nr:MAG: protein translocase subunit SecD [Candidatus Kaiserbacteria bacterium CG10_big_fil_rev_8_21_14_0_10_49_17]
MWQKRLVALIILIAGLGVGYFLYQSETSANSHFPFTLGLDLAGGTHLVYRADVSEIPERDVADSMSALRSVIERRVNLFGVSEPIVQVEKGGFFAGVSEERLIIELPGVTDTAKAIELIGRTPVLEFKLLKEGMAPPSELSVLTPEGVDALFDATGLTGRYLKTASVGFGQGSAGLSNEPYVLLTFNSEGGDLFAQITREHTGEYLGIFLDGALMSVPVIREEITGGSATISGAFTPEEAKALAQNLNLGALPVPIELISTQTIGSTLGSSAVGQGVFAGAVGLIAVALFMLLWYRTPGVIAVIALAMYLAVMLAIFKLIPVTLTAAGVAGFILSLGMAVDANVLIFERMKEELKDGKAPQDAIKDGFARAWFSIRDGNASSIITAIILYWLGTSLVEGFALTFGIGVIMSMLTAIVVSRTLLYAVAPKSNRRLFRILFGSGVYFK